MPPISPFVVGTAGSGKSTLVSAFSEWLATISGDPVVVNLDPGADALPYVPNVDIRSWIKIDDIMREHSLGPNGAQVLAADMVALNIAEVRREVDAQGGDVVLYDTPGQIELFAFRAASEQILHSLSEEPVVTYLFDPVISSTAKGFTTLLMLASTVHFRFRVPYLPVLTKVDMLPAEDIERIILWSRESGPLFEALSRETGMDAEIARLTLESLEALGVYRSLTPVSSETLLGMEDIYTAMRMAYRAGEDIELPAQD